MKKFRIILLLSLLIMFTSCPFPGHIDKIPSFSYLLFLSIQDESGNDLVKGLDCYPLNDSYKGTFTLPCVEIMAKEYDFNVVFSKPCVKGSYMSSSLYMTTTFPTVWLDSNSNIDYLVFVVHSSREKNCMNDDSTLNFQLSLPRVFGDNEKREIVSYWSNYMYNFMRCTKLEIDGKEITEFEYDGNITKAVLIVNRN